MAKINYGPPATNPTDRPSMSRHDALGPGMMIGMSQRAAELAVSAPSSTTRHH